MGWQFNGRLLPDDEIGVASELRKQRDTVHFDKRFAANELAPVYSRRIGRDRQVPSLLGRAFTTFDDGPVAVISESWRRMGNDPAILGSVIQAGSVHLTIVASFPQALIKSGASMHGLCPT